MGFDCSQYLCDLMPSQINRVQAAGRHEQTFSGVGETEHTPLLTQKQPFTLLRWLHLSALAHSKHHQECCDSNNIRGKET